MCKCTGACVPAGQTPTRASHVIVCDLALVQAYGKIDILVSNAAVNPTAGPLLETSPDAIDKILDINIKAALLLVQAAAKHMRRGGRIVLISSVTAYQ